jgi:hypothetical protein
MNAVKEAAGSFTPDAEATEAAGGASERKTTTGSGTTEETYGERHKYGQSRTAARVNAIGRLAVLTLMTTYVFPKILDKLARKITGDNQAKAPRGGTLGFASNLYETAAGERTPASMITSVFTPALGTEEGIEVAVNRDFFTGKHVMGTDVGYQDKVKQLGAWITSRSMPGQITHKITESKGRQAMYGLLGFSFPLTHGLREAAEIRGETSSANPTDPQKARVFMSIMAAAQQAQRSGGQNTTMEDALLDSDVLTPSQRKELAQAVYDPPIVFAVTGLERDVDVWRVYQHSTDEEKQQLVDDGKSYKRLANYANELRDNGDDETADKIDKVLQ